MHSTSNLGIILEGARGFHHAESLRGCLFHLFFAHGRLQTMEVLHILKEVQRRILQFAACAFFLLVAFTPMLECFDRWDKPTTPMTDTELRVTAWLVVAGTVAVVAHLVRSAVLTVARGEASLHVIPALQLVSWHAPCCEVPTASPPLIPLRI
jgi:hypothetical protein